MSEVDVVLARLRPLPLRLRIAHLAALLRHERRANVCACPSPREASLSDPSPRKGEGSTTTAATKGGRG
jgi:hypothetical protein